MFRESRAAYSIRTVCPGSVQGLSLLSSGLAVSAAAAQFGLTVASEREQVSSSFVARMMRPHARFLPA